MAREWKVRDEIEEKTDGIERKIDGIEGKTDRREEKTDRKRLTIVGVAYVMKTTSAILNIFSSNETVALR